MVKVIFIKNPFNPANGRTVKISEVTDKPISFYVDEFIIQIPEKKAWLQINGRTVPDITQNKVILDEIVPDDSFIIVMPSVQKGGKNPLALIASIALSVVSMGVGNLLAPGIGSFFGGGAAWGLGSYLGAAAVMFLGGSLVGKLAMPKVDMAYSGYNEDPTYGWNGVQTMEGQGNGIALTYGTVKSGGQSIVKYTTTSADNQYLNWLIAAGEGPVKITNITLNDNPIENYESVEYETREGINNQTVIKNFNDTIQTKVISYELENDWRTDYIEGNSAEGIIIDVECSQGLYHANDNGTLGQAWVEISAQYALDGTEDWRTILKNERITGSKTGAVRMQYRYDNLLAGRYKVRIKVDSRSAAVSSSRDGVRIWWTGISSVVYDDFAYPNIALIGIKAKATSQLSGSSPRCTFYKTRDKVWVYNPHTLNFEERAADNPAWAAYDFLAGIRRMIAVNHGGNYKFVCKGVPYELMMYDQFDAWAKNCDNLKLKINIEITQISDFLSTVNKEIAAVGRGIVVQFGTKFGCIYDHSTQPVQLFNMGNILAGSFNLNYQSSEERADCIEITFCNKDKNYEKDTLTIFGDTYDDADIVNNPTQITMNGITSYEQAYREGKYQLMCNKFLKTTISFKTDVEAIGCMVGDQILVAHDVPLWALSGRIIDVYDQSKSFVLPLDPADITMTATNYALLVRSDDNRLHTYRVQSIDGEYGSVHITVAEDVSPDIVSGNLFALGKVEGVVKPFVVRSIKRDKDLIYNITAIEYAEGVFDENYDIPIPDYSLSDSKKPQNVIDLQATVNVYTDSVNKPAATMYITWRLPYKANADSFSVFLSEDDGENWQLVSTAYKLSLDVAVKPFTKYKIKVVTNYGMLSSSGTIIDAEGSGLDRPEDVAEPVIFQPPSELTNNGNEVWIATKGQDETWGGCEVWMARDSETGTYFKIGEVYKECHIGTLDNDISVDDTSFTIHINGPISGSGTFWLDGECITVMKITRIAAGQYKLENVKRGQFSTKKSSHLAETKIVYLDGNVLKYPVRKIDIGSAVWFKFCSYNIFGGDSQSLDEVRAYQYRITNYYLPPVTDVTAYTRYRQLVDGTVQYDIVVDWVPPESSTYLQAQVWYKSDHAQADNICVVEGIPADELGFQGEWIYAGSGKNQVIISQAVAGDTYEIAVCTQDEYGVSNEVDNSPKVKILVTHKTNTPNTPDNFKIDFNENIKVSWDEVTNADILYYEVRNDNKPGAETTWLLSRTSGTSAVINLSDRKGFLYLYAKGTSGKYSAPAMLEYNKEVPPIPAPPRVTSKLGGMSIVAESIPNGCNGMNVYINDTAVHTVNNTLTYTCDAGIYDVRVAYTDLFGEGEKSGETRCIVKITIGGDDIEDGSISADKVDQEIKDTIDKINQQSGINESIQNAIKNMQGGIDDAKAEIDNVRQDAKNIINELNKLPSESKFVSINKTDEEIKVTAAKAEEIDGKVTKQATQIQQNAESISSVAAKLIQAEGKIEANTSKIEQTATDIKSYVSSQIEDVKAEVKEEATSVVHQEADKIMATVNKRIEDAEGKITENTSLIQQTSTEIKSIISSTEQKLENQISQTASQISQTKDEILLTVNETSRNLDGKITQNSSQIQQNKLQISSMVTDIEAVEGKTNANSSKIEQTSNRITSVVNDLEGNYQDSQFKAIKGIGSAVDQTSKNINLVVTELNKPPEECSYSAINVLENGIKLSVKDGEIINKINLSKEGITINGNRIHITGDTVFDDNVIVGKMLQAGSITADKVDVKNLSSITATIGTLRTSTSGARMELKDNLIQIFDGDNKLRVRMGVW